MRILYFENRVFAFIISIENISRKLLKFGTVFNEVKQTFFCHVRFFLKFCNFS